ncbi:hypothetical protein AXF24_12785 [Streptococcus pneumoniae]|nr:hypothetical protein AWW74_12800 [Streptococcus pneumoniae]KXB94552.1 hypothetical protein AXF24_12785 [Streptococcus pneumoniae]
MVGVHHVMQRVGARVDLDVGADPGAQARCAITGRVLLHCLLDLVHELPRVALRQRLQDLGAGGEIGIESALGHVGRGDDVADGGGVHTLRKEQRLRGVHHIKQRRANPCYIIR